MDRIRVMIIDEDEFFRAGVCQSLSHESDLQIFDCALTQNTLRLIELNPPDVIIFGFNLNTFSSLALSRIITQGYPSTIMIVLSPDPNDVQLFELVKFETVGCLSRYTTAEELTNTIRQVCSGEHSVDDSPIPRPKVTKHVLHKLQHMRRTVEAVATPLTFRETQILNYVAEGNSNKQIARILQISDQTIKNHISAILRKLHANDRAHAVVLSIRHGWIPVERKYEDMIAVA